MAYSKSKRKPYKKKSKAVTVKDVKKIIRGVSETKRKIGHITGQFAYNTNPHFSLTDIGIGTSDVARIGDQATPTHLKVNMVLDYAVDTFVRVVIYRWKPDSVTYTQSNVDLFEYPTYVTSGYFWDKKQQFSIIHDKTYHMTPNNNNAGKKMITISKKLKQPRIQFTSGGIQGTNKIYMAVFTDELYAFSTPYYFNYKTLFEDV